MKKGINRRERGENQLGLLLNTHNKLKKGKQASLCRPLLHCWSVVRSATPALNLNGLLRVCVFGRGFIQMTYLHTNNLSPFTEGKENMEERRKQGDKQGVCLSSSGAEGDWTQAGWRRNLIASVMHCLCLQTLLQRGFSMPSFFNLSVSVAKIKEKEKETGHRIKIFFPKQTG